MKRLIESFTPYHKSALWRIHEAYYPRRGIQAWSEGDIPFRPTSNGGVARQFGELLIERFGAAKSEISILEIGGGNGGFVGQLLSVLENGLGAPGKAIYERLRYVFSDYARSTLDAVAIYPPHERQIKRGRLVPALLDLRGADRPRGLDGKSIDGSFDIVLANYVICVLPTVFLRREEERWGELQVQISFVPDENAPVGSPAPATADDLIEIYRSGAFGFNLHKNLETEYEWQPVSLDALFSSPLHAQILKRVVGDGEGMLPYPYAFIDFVARAGAWLKPGGFVLACDYGSPQASLEVDPRPTVYGDSLNHAVQFVVFDAFVAEQRWGLLRTEDPLQVVQHVLLSPSTIDPALRDTFQRCFVDRIDGADLVDFIEAARVLKDKGDHLRASRFYARAVKIERHNARLNHEAAQSCLQAGKPEIAMNYLVAFSQLDGPGDIDYEFQWGMAHYQLGQYEIAVDWFKRSLKREAHVATWWNLALTFHAMGDVKQTVRSLREVLDAEPQHEMANKLAAQIKEDWWKHTTGEDE